MIHLFSGITGRGKIDPTDRARPSTDNLRRWLIKELSLSTSLQGHMDSLQSKPIFDMSCLVACEFLSSHPLEYQGIAAELSLLIFYIEDVLYDQFDIVLNVQQRVAMGKSCGDPVLDWFFFDCAPGLWKLFDPLIANMIMVSCHDFISGMQMESFVEESQVHAQAPAFPDYVRYKTGISTMYALLALTCASNKEIDTGGVKNFVQVMPDAITFTNIINDVFSFYKEYLANERGIYINLRSQKDRVPREVTLRALAEEGIAVFDRVLDVLSNEPIYRVNFETFAKGIVHYHTSCQRYRLTELFEGHTD